FCSHCKVIGHHVGICKKLNYGTEDQHDKESQEKRKQLKDANKVYVQTKDGRVGSTKEIVDVESDKVDVTIPVN
ncbi:hypothetical protein A2U01_0100317, partial [Trifolium medium]|nr:hypothetical protein [Trifolium medium]